MNKRIKTHLILAIMLCSPVFGAEIVEYTVAGLNQDAEIRVDTWGIPHIYAQDHYDAFFVQGFNAARDRLWQIDLWRRRGLGELAEVLGAGFVEQDKAARLFLYRGSMFREWLAYGSDAKRISTSFTRGINAYIDLVQAEPDLLPMEFRVLDYQPARWSPEDPVRIRSNGLWRNVRTEVIRANVVCSHGLRIDAMRKKLEPDWQTKVPEGLDPCDIPNDVLKLYSLAKAPVDFSRTLQVNAGLPPDYRNAMAMLADNIVDAGSNNWAVSPAKTSTERPILANDPHRGHAVPSLRYVAHLVAPGLNVIGAGEPGLPGISIGHNEKIAFGLTIFSIDQEDLVIYETRKNNYKYRGKFEPMDKITEQIKVRDAPTVNMDLLFTRDGPVIYTDAKKNRAFAVRAAWLEPGMAPYFGSVEYMRAENWDQFLGALNRWGAPAENQVYADVDGNIGYKPAGLTPIRSNYDGLLPIPGDGRYEWHGFYDMDELPVQFNPESGYVATANAMSLPVGFPYKDKIIGFEWANPWRINRIERVLEETNPHTLQTSISLQRDYFSEPAKRILSLVDVAALPEVARQLFQQWDYEISRDSASAALFEIWFNHYLVPELTRHGTQLDDISALRSLDKLAAIEHFEHLDKKERQSIAVSTLTSAQSETSQLLGQDYSGWRWGDLHEMKFKHPLYDIVSDEDRTLLGIAPVARGGSADTPNSTRYRSDFSVASGGSWRMVVDVGNWDAAVMTNAPGQSGDPASPHYDDMLQTWADEGHMPLLYSRDKVVSHTQKLIKLLAVPAQ
ncbi:MAG: penicillin acylase family protein [bacterium]